MKTLIQSILLAGLILIPSGCTTTPDGQRRLDPVKVSLIVREAAEVGSTWDLQTNPEHRDYYIVSLELVNGLLDDGNFDRTALANALKGLPIKELKSNSGVLIVGAAVTVYDAYAGEVVNLDGNVYMRPVIEAIRDGLKAGLDATKDQATKPEEEPTGS